MKKFIINIKCNDKRYNISSLLNDYENISIFDNKKNICVEILCTDLVENVFTENQIKKDFDSFEIENIKKDDWITRNILDDKAIKSELFLISQGLLKVKKNKKYNLIVPANNAFGTGSHASTFLSIRCIEILTKKKKYFKVCDLGTGSGILSFVLEKILKRKIICIDNDIQIEDTLFKNKKKNNLNKIKFYKNDGLRGKCLMGIKFDLIVCNILSNFHKGIVGDYSEKLDVNGNIIISGILKHQINEIISYFYKFNLKLIMKFHLLGWASLIFTKQGIKNASKF